MVLFVVAVVVGWWYIAWTSHNYAHLEYSGWGVVILHSYLNTVTSRGVEGVAICRACSIAYSVYIYICTHTYSYLYIFDL